MSAVPNLQLIDGGIEASNGAPTSVSTYEAMRLAVLDEVAQSKIDSRNRDAVAALVRAHVEQHQRTAESGNGLRFSNPSDIASRLVRSLVGAGPFEKFFMLRVFGIAHSVHELLISPNAADVFRWTSAFASRTDRVLDA